MRVVIKDMLNGDIVSDKEQNETDTITIPSDFKLIFEQKNKLNEVWCYVKRVRL